MSDRERDQAPIHSLSKYRTTKGSDPTLVPCANCGGLINMYTVKCQHCGTNFMGPAFQFAPNYLPQPSPRPLAVRAIAWLIALLVLGTVAALLFRLVTN